MRSGELAGHAYGLKWVWDTKE